MNTIDTQQQAQTCKDCSNYLSYYMRDNGGCRYRQLMRGFCSTSLKQKKEDDISCSNFVHKSQIETKQKQRLVDALEKALYSINPIARILTEKEE